MCVNGLPGILSLLCKTVCVFVEKRKVGTHMYIDYPQKKMQQTGL